MVHAQTHWQSDSLYLRNCSRIQTQKFGIGLLSNTKNFSLQFKKNANASQGKIKKDLKGLNDLLTGDLMPLTTISTYLLHRLQALVVRHVFVVPGDYVLGFYKTLEIATRSH